MPQFLRIFSVVLMVSAMLIAQDLSTIGAGNSGTLFEDGIIYDQTGNPGTNGSPSQFFPDFLGAGESADDFTVPAGEVWTVDTVYIVGTFSGTGGYVSVDVNIYLDDGPGGMPGTLFYNENVLAAVAGTGPIFTVPLSTPMVLPEGHHWFNFMVNMPFTPEGQFFWSNSNVPQIDSFRVFRDSTDLFGTGSFANWATCEGSTIGGGVEPDLQYAFYGSVGTATSCNLLFDAFDTDISSWTEVGPLGIGNWSWQSTNNAAGAAAGELQFSWTPSFTGDSYIISPVLPSDGLINTISFQHFVDYFGAGLTVGAAYTTDGGTTWTTIWSVVDPPGNVGPELVVVNAPGDANFQLGFFYSGNSFQIDFWYVDDVCVDGVIPVELTSFTSSVNKRNVTLDWTTATEINNQGFEIERNSGNGFEKIGYVAGFGTSTEPHSYSFIDASVTEGIHYYRLKQLDFDGTFEYFDAIEVDVSVPNVFALGQNYPNPFNPSTKIDFSLEVDSKVTLKIFDVLGQEVANLVNTNLAAGSHNVEFNASLLNSGVYFYRIEAVGINGAKFVDVKKMNLLK